MLDADAFRLQGVRFADTPDAGYGSILDDIIKDYEMPISSEEVELEESNEQTSSYKKTDESILVKRICCLFLNECLDKLSILRVMTREKVESSWFNNFCYKPSDQRFTIEEDEFDMYEYTNMRKLAKLICTMQNILYNTLTEVERFKSTNYFLQTITNMEKEETDMVDLYASFTNNLQDLILYNKKLLESYHKNKNTYDQKTDDFHRIEQNYENMILLSEIELRHVNKWEENRCYLNDFTNNSKEKQLLNTVQEYDHKIALENRVHGEISSYIKQSVNHSTEEIERWMDFYDDEVERLEGAIFEVKVDKERCETSFRLLQNEYESRSKEIEEWLAFKERLRIIEEELLKQTNAAIKIQALWRGVMVRRHLGPYAKKKRKGKKGKKGTKGKNVKKTTKKTK